MRLLAGGWGPNQLDVLRTADPAYELLLAHVCDTNVPHTLEPSTPIILASATVLTLLYLGA